MFLTELSKKSPTSKVCVCVCVCVWGGGEDVTPHLLHGPHVIYASTWQVWIPELHY